MKVSFRVFGPVAGQGSMRAFTRKGGGVGMDHSQKTKTWRVAVAWEAAKAMKGEAMLEGALELEVAYWLPRPKTAPKSRHEPHVKPDLDKLIRACGDAMEGIVYQNDSQIVAVTARKSYADSREAVGAWVGVSEVESV